MKKKIMTMLAAMMCLGSSSLSYSSVAIAANSLNSNDIAEVKITSSDLKECNLVTESKNDGCWINLNLESGVFAMSGSDTQSFSVIGTFERKDSDLYLYPENASAEFYVLHREEDYFVSQSDEMGVQLKEGLVFNADNDAFWEILLDWTLSGNEPSNTGETAEQNISFIMGDVNGDGSFGVSDVVLLQKWLLAVPDTHLANWKAADFCEDNKLDVFDLTLMKRALLEGINSPDEPPATEIAPLEFNSTDDAVKAINANDLSDYYSPYREAYESMFKQFREEGFVYSVKTNDNVAFAENSKIRLFPDHALEDMCIKYSVMYQGKKYNISFRCANMDVISETNGITEYVKKRWGSKTDHEIMIGDKTYTISNATDGSQIAAMAFIDVTHYIQVIGFDSVAEEELTELLNALEYEKISLNTIGEPPADLIAPLGFQTADDAIKEIIQSEYSIIEGYAQMFERFRNDGFIYHFTDAENAITLREDRTNAAVWLMPYDYFEDTGIRYNVVYQGKDYQVYYYFTDPAFPASDLWDYMEQRLHTENINVVDGKYGIVDHNNGGNPVVSAYFAIDDTHYCKIRTYEPEEALMDFLQVLSSEKTVF
jgi:hypothetical protein